MSGNKSVKLELYHVTFPSKFNNVSGKGKFNIANLAAESISVDNVSI